MTGRVRTGRFLAIVVSIARVTEELVPIMAGVYLLAAAIVILFNVTAIPVAIGEILAGAFGFSNVGGGLIVVISGAYLDPVAGELGGVALTSAAFAFSTMLTWSYSGMKATGHLAGDRQLAETVSKVVFCVVVIVGASLSLGPVIGISDSMIFLMAIPNVLGMYILARSLEKEIVGYRAKVTDGTVAKVGEPEHRRGSAGGDAVPLSGGRRRCRAAPRPRRRPRTPRGCAPRGEVVVRPAGVRTATSAPAPPGR